MLFYNIIIYGAIYGAIFGNMIFGSIIYNFNKIRNLGNMHILDRIDILDNHNIIINFDDLIEFYKDQDIASIITKTLPILNNYKKTELVISKEKIDNIIMNIPQIVINENNPDDNIPVYHEYAIEIIKNLVNKTNIDISIIYSENAEIAIDYYISKTASTQNINNIITHVVKNCPIDCLRPYWDLSMPSKILMIKKKYITLYKINLYNDIDIDINIPYIKPIKDFLE